MKEDGSKQRSVSAVHRGAGFTMVELVLALAITGMIGLAVSSMLVSVSYGTTSQADLRRASVKEKVIALRMNLAISSSKMVLDQGVDYLILWMGDQRQNGLPDLSEIRRIDRDSTTLELWSYAAPPGLADADNTQYGFANDFETITAALAGTTNFPGEVWGTNVTAWTQTLNQTNPQAATIVGYSITMMANDVTGTATNTLSFRSR